jgi:hypothetical protein
MVAPELPWAKRWEPEPQGHTTAPELPRVGLLLVVSGDFFLVASYWPTKNNRVLKNAILQRSRHRRCSYALAIIMSSSSIFSGHVSVLRCLVLFNGTNYHDWIPRMRLHMRGLHLWDFLTGELPCSPSPSAPAQPVILEKTTAAEKEKLLADYEDHLASYESQFHAYRTWLDEDARAGSVLIASMEDHFTADIVDFKRTHQMWSFLHQKYKSTGQSSYLAAIH